MKMVTESKLESYKAGLIFSSVLAALVVPIISYSQYDEQDTTQYHEFTQAYNICSQASSQMAKQECNYGRVFEGYYMKCMHNQGYADDEILDQEYYKGYLAAYKYCSSISDKSTKEYCGYERLYNAHYSQCMMQKGFDANDENVTDGSAAQPYFQYDF